MRPNEVAEYNEDIAQQDEYLHPHDATMSSNFAACWLLVLWSVPHKPPNMLATEEHLHLSLHLFLQPMIGSSDVLISMVCEQNEKSLRYGVFTRLLRSPFFVFGRGLAGAA